VASGRDAPEGGASLLLFYLQIRRSASDFITKLGHAFDASSRAWPLRGPFNRELLASAAIVSRGRRPRSPEARG